MSKRYRVSEYTDFSLGDGLPYCRWVVREGNGTPYWAMTTCKKGFNPLTRVRHVGEIKKVYDGCYCPICGRPIKTSGYVFDDDFVESEHNYGIIKGVYWYFKHKYGERREP